MKSKLVYALFLALMGCAPSNMDLVKADPQGHLQLKVDMGHEQVYRLLAQKSREIWDVHKPDCDLYSDRGIIQLAAGTFGREVHLVAEIWPEGKGSARVEMYYSTWVGRRMSGNFVKWVKEADIKAGGN